MQPNFSRYPGGTARWGTDGKLEVVNWVLFLALAAAAAPLPQGRQASVRGKLVQQDGKPPAIETSSHELVIAEGEPETIAVLNDKRLSPYEVELVGHYDGPGRFAVGPFYTATSIIVHKDGKRYSVSYWCPICSIRAYKPGKCVCCQRETDLDLQEMKDGR